MLFDVCVEAALPFGPPISLEVAAHRHVGPLAAHDPARGLAAAIGVVEQVWGLLRPQPAVRARSSIEGPSVHCHRAPQTCASGKRIESTGGEGRSGAHVAPSYTKSMSFMGDWPLAQWWPLSRRGQGSGGGDGGDGGVAGGSGGVRAA